MATITKSIQHKRATAASWTSNNPTLLAGQLGWESDTNKLKIGDGTTAWNSLSYFSSGITLSSNGIVVRTAADTYTSRTATGTSNRISITNGDGVSGNPTIDIAATYVGQTSITTLGTITTGTWNGTAIGVVYGGTGLTSIAADRIMYATGANTIGTSANFSFNGTLLQSGGASALFSEKFAVKASADAVVMTLQNTTASQGTGFLIAESSSVFGGFYRFGSTYVGNQNGTSIALASQMRMSSGASSALDKPVMIAGTPVYNVVGVTATNFGTRLDATGLRIGQIQNLHSSNSYAFQLDGDMKCNGTNTTGGGSAALGSNCPATTATAPYTWIKFIAADNSTIYIPAWK